MKQPVDEIHQAGDNSELRLEKLTRAAGRKNNWSVHGSVRIPDPDGGRREIDLILISGSVVLVVEQKHWSGRFEVKEDGEFIQHRNNGTMHSHATVAHRAYTHWKVYQFTLQHHLQRGNNVVDRLIACEIAEIA